MYIPIAVVGSWPYSQHWITKMPFVSLHHQLVSSADHFNVILWIELYREKQWWMNMIVYYYLLIKIIPYFKTLFVLELKILQIYYKLKDVAMFHKECGQTHTTPSPFIYHTALDTTWKDHGWRYVSNFKWPNQFASVYLTIISDWWIAGM